MATERLTSWLGGEERSVLRPGSTESWGIPRNAEVVGFAPAKGPHVCLSRAGRWRAAHVRDRDGTCILCDRRLILGD